MNSIKFGCLFWTLVFVFPVFANRGCGIRTRPFLPLISQGWRVQEGQWPWHVGLFHKIENGTEYKCGASLIDERHILTAAHCVVLRGTSNPMPAEDVLLYFGLTDQLNKTKHVQKRNVAQIHVHPDYEVHRNDIAVLEFKPGVDFTALINPICLVTTMHKDLRDMTGQRGWITGWGKTENGTLSDELRSASLPVVNITQCLENDRRFFGGVLNDNVFCAGERNGTSPGQGDSGGGMYFSEGDHWVLRGIVSFAKYNRNQLDVDTSKFAVFTNVQRFLTWIRKVTNARDSSSGRAKRISETECDRFKGFIKTRRDGSCMYDRPHSVYLLDDDEDLTCNGILVTENHVLTSCECAKIFSPGRGKIDEHSTINFSEHICHPLHADNGDFADIAVIELDSPVELSHSIIPACLASNWTENLYDTLLTATFIDQYYLELYHSNDSQVVSSQRCKSNFIKELLPDQLCVTNRAMARYYRFASIGTALQTFNTRNCLFTVVGVLSLEYSGTESATDLKLLPEGGETAAAQTLGAPRSFYNIVTARIDGYNDIHISNRTCHPMYDFVTLTHDIAIVRLAAAVNIIPACLTSNWTDNFDLLTVIGSDFFSETKGEMNVTKVLTAEECNRDVRIVSKNITVDAAQQFCVISNNRIFPNFLHMANNQTCVFSLLGILSREVGQDDDGNFDVFSHLTPYLDWIEEIVWGAQAVPQATVSSISVKPTTIRSSPTRPIEADPLVNDGKIVIPDN